MNPFFANRASEGLKIANRRFEATRANRSHVMKIGIFLRIDSRESIRANCPDSRCELPGHLSSCKKEPQASKRHININFVHLPWGQGQVFSFILQ